MVGALDSRRLPPLLLSRCKPVGLVEVVWNTRGVVEEVTHGDRRPSVSAKLRKVFVFFASLDAPGSPHGHRFAAARPRSLGDDCFGKESGATEVARLQHQAQVRVPPPERVQHRHTRREFAADEERFDA